MPSAAYTSLRYHGFANRANLQQGHYVIPYANAPMQPAAISTPTSSESCDERVASLERKRMRLVERLSLCLRDRSDFSTSANSPRPTVATTGQQRTINDQPATHEPRRLKRHAAARRLLLLQASAGQPSASTPFALGESETNNCAVGFSQLASEATCQAAAAQFELTFQGSEEAADYPKGCYAYPGEGVYFNMHKTGAAEYDSTPVCRDDSFTGEKSNASTPTPPPTLVKSTPSILPIRGQIVPVLQADSSAASPKQMIAHVGRRH